MSSPEGPAGRAKPAPFFRGRARGVTHPPAGYQLEGFDLTVICRWRTRARFDQPELTELPGRFLEGWRQIITCRAGAKMQ